MSRGKTGRGQSRQTCPHPRHGDPRSGCSRTPALPFPGHGRGFALRPPAAPRSGNFCGKGSRRQGRRCGPGRAHLGHLPPHDPGPPAAPAGGAGEEGEAALTCCRRSARAPSLPELHLPMKSPAAGALHAAARSGPASRPAPRPPPPQRHRHRPGRGPQASRSAAPRPPPAPLLDSGEEGRRRQAGALRPGGVGRAAAEPGNRGRRGKERGAACLSCAWASSHLASPSAKRLC